MVYRRFLNEKLIIFAGILLMSGCATVNLPNLESGPVTLQDDEKRLMNHSKRDIESIDHSGLIYEDRDVETFLNQIVNKLLPSQDDLSGVHIDVKVIKDPDLNAFGMPTGRIYVHTGVLAAADNEAQVATILGHEMTHVLHRHIIKRFRSFNNALTFWDSVGLATGGLGIIVSELAKGSSVSGFSQDLETEADEFGFQLVKKAGYDTAQTVKMFEALQEYITDEQERQPFFFSSHPNVQQRINNFNRLIKGDGQENKPDNAQDSYKTLVHELRKVNIQFCLERGLYHTAQRQLERFLVLYPDDDRGWVLKGDLYRDRQDPPKGSKERDKKKDYPTALEGYDHALSVNPVCTDALRGKGRVLYAMGQKEEAKIYFQQYLEHQPDAKDKSFIQRLIQ